MAKQAMKKECDINAIMKRYEKTGLVEHVNRYNGQYADVTMSGDYQSALQIIMDADTMFSSLPARIRDKFENDPREFLDFVENPDNAKELTELGLATKRDTTPAPGTTPLETAAPQPSEPT